MVKLGLVSISFRKLTPARVAELVAQSGLEGIEWGGDVHVPHGDVAVARQVRALTLEKELSVAAYGSYYQVGTEGTVPFSKVLDSAAALGAPTIRVWAGKVASADATIEHWDRLIYDTQRIADQAAKQGMTISFEYHRKTLTDTRESAERLLNGVAHPQVFCYWQPPIGLTVEERLAGLEAVLPRLTNVHVYHWSGPANERRPISEGAEEWKRYFGRIASTGREHYALIEFVRDDAPEAFLRDAATLQTWRTSFT